MRLLLADGLFWTSVACCLIAQLSSSLRSRAWRAADVPESDGAACRAAQPALELLWAVLPAVALAVLLCFTWRAIAPAVEHRRRRRSRPPEPDA